MTRRVVLDTSALVTLEMVDLLWRLDFLDLATGQTVADELEELAAYEDSTAEAAQRVLGRLDAGDIDVREVLDDAAVEALTSARVDRAEAECLVLCREWDGDVLVTDDARAIAGLREAARADGVEIRISVAAVVELHRRGEISEAEARPLVEEIVVTRGWEGGVLEVLAQRYL